MAGKAPALLPRQYWWAMDALSKNALIDLVWSLAGQTVESAEDAEDCFRKIREEWGIVAGYRGDTVNKFDYAAKLQAARLSLEQTHAGEP
jgi:hypothetical protein